MTKFKPISFAAGKDQVFITRHYMTGSGNTLAISWEEAAKLHEWLGDELNWKRSLDNPPRFP